MTDILFTNARIVREAEVVSGTLVVRGGSIHDISGGSTRAEGVDCDGDLLIPGLVELHTDNLERHIEPRPGVDWPRQAALIAHDRELAGAGITTVFDAMRVGSSTDGRDYRAYARGLATDLLALRGHGALRISHHIHLRAEICSETLIEELAEFGPEDRVSLLSLMDHTPGQRQFRDIDKLRVYYEGKRGSAPGGFEAHVARLRAQRARVGDAQEAGAVAAARRFGAALASHDDTTEAQVAASARHGVALAEFPTTREAAAACRTHGIAVMMGAPNLVRGGSHSGNVSASELAEADLLDILSSDYVPASLLLGAVMLGRFWGDMARGIATVTTAPARAAGLTDRGVLEPGRRADVVRLREVDGMALTAGVWVRGARVA